MDRRKFTIGLGSLAAGGVGVGTGAFSSISADRNITVEVSGDASALLSIKPGNKNGEYTTGAKNGTLGVDLSDSNGDLSGEGVNIKSLTWIEDMFRIENQGTQTVELELDSVLFTKGLFTPQDIIGALLVPSDGTIVTPIFDEPYHIVELPVGEEVEYSMGVVALDADVPSSPLKQTMEITAEAV